MTQMEHHIRELELNGTESADIIQQKFNELDNKVSDRLQGQVNNILSD